jgi:hypothetical protein
MLLCYDYQNGITYEKEDIIFATKSKLFSIGINGLPETNSISENHRCGDHGYKCE